MNTTVISIRAIEETDEFRVLMAIDGKPEEFTFKVEKPKQDPFAVVGGDIRFCKFFRFNQHIAIEVTNLVGKIYQGQPVELPVDVSPFATPKEALALQKTFEKQVEKVKI